MTDSLALRLENIFKHFPGVQALDDVTFELHQGEVHALVGENGAGKSTLLKVLSGVHQADSGRVIIAGDEVKIDSPRRAHDLGISIMYQEFGLADNISVAENIVLGREPTRMGLVDRKAMLAECKRCLDMVGVDIDCNVPVEELSVAMQQVVEIAKAMSWNARIIAMDEPTASLTENEIEALFDLIRRLRQSGASIIYVSHRLEEIFRIADRITVLRDGKCIGTLSIGEADRAKLIHMMVGREVDEAGRDREVGRDKPILEVRGLCTPDKLYDIRFKLYPGEILGLAGLVGAGRTELLRALMGADMLSSGGIYLNGEQVQIRHPADAVRLGIGLVPEDRKRHGLVLHMSVCNNLTLACLDELCSYGFIDQTQDIARAIEYVETLDIRTPSLEQEVLRLSGGNQQKIVVGKWLARRPQILLLDEPTRGIDVGTKAQIHNIIRDLADQGIALLVSYSELPELLSVADRVLVMKNGRLTGEYLRSEATGEKILQDAM
jgi:ribose transport system ATP-binding protein